MTCVRRTGQASKAFGVHRERKLAILRTRDKTLLVKAVRYTDCFQISIDAMNDKVKLLLSSSSAHSLFGTYDKFKLINPE